MKKTYTRAARFVFSGLLIGSCACISGCDFGNKTNDTTSQGAEEGTIREGDNADDAHTAADTAQVDSFQ